MHIVVRVHSFKKYVMGANYVLNTILSTGDRMENKIIPPLRRLLITHMYINRKIDT